jgi:transposase
MGRSSFAVSAVPDLPSPIPDVGQGRNVARRAGRLGYGLARPGQARPDRGVHRWLPRGGQKGGSCVGLTRRGKATKIMAVADRNGLPLAAWIAGGERHESKLVVDTLDENFLEEAPERLIGDKAYDSDSLDSELAARQIKMIAPHRAGRSRPPTQDGRELRRYRRRWKVERLFAWLLRFRRVATRWDLHAENFLGFVHLGCLVILLRQL